MDATQTSFIETLVGDPQEALAVEIKSWLDLSDTKDVAKLVKNLLALRNHDGGYIVIGFTDDTLEQQPSPDGIKTREAFHIDEIQPLVVRFASEPFEISIKFVSRGEQEHPVIIVPGGVKTPVVAKSDLMLSGRSLIRSGDVFVRSLNSNRKPSTAKANWKDWPNIMDICFDNREADIGKFIQRHLTARNSVELMETIHRALKTDPNTKNANGAKNDLLDYGYSRFSKLAAQRLANIPKIGTWEVAAVVNGDIKEHRPDKNFLNTLSSANPRLNGWPIWRDSRGASNETERPFVFEGAWESFMVSLNSDWDHLDYMRLEPKGRFYLLRGLQDDLTPSHYGPSPGTQLDFGIQVLRVTEAIAVAIAFGKAMGARRDSSSADFQFRWSSLAGRELSSWANPARYISGGRVAVQDTVSSTITVPFSAPASSYPQYVVASLQPLFEVFDGFSLSSKVYEDLVYGLLERRN